MTAARSNSVYFKYIGRLRSLGSIEDMALREDINEDWKRDVRLEPIVAAFGGAIVASVLGAILSGFFLH